MTISVTRVFAEDTKVSAEVNVEVPELNALAVIRMSFDADEIPDKKWAEAVLDRALVMLDPA